VLALCGPARAAAPPCPPEALRGAIVSGQVLACLADEDDEVSAWFQPLRGGRPTQVDSLRACVGIPLRWHVAHGALWLAKSSGDLYTGAPGNETAYRYELPELLKGRRLIGDQGPAALRKVVGYARVLEALGYVKDGR
jgi:hypothetical protein